MYIMRSDVTLGGAMFHLLQTNKVNKALLIENIDVSFSTCLDSMRLCYEDVAGTDSPLLLSSSGLLPAHGSGYTPLGLRCSHTVKPALPVLDPHGSKY